MGVIDFRPFPVKRLVEGVRVSKGRIEAMSNSRLLDQVAMGIRCFVALVELEDCLIGPAGM